MHVLPNKRNELPQIRSDKSPRIGCQKDAQYSRACSELEDVRVFQARGGEYGVGGVGEEAVGEYVLSEFHTE